MINIKLYQVKEFIILIAIVLYSTQIGAQNISGIVNIYTPVTAIAACDVTVQSSAGFSVGDRVLIIQMKGTGIDITNTPSFGTITGYNDCGNYEFSTIQSIAGNVITLQYSLLRTYTISGMVQLVRVPVYNNANINATLTCQPWNVTTGTGGVLVFIDNGTTTFNADIDVRAKGFQGTVSQTIGWASCSVNYIESQASIEALKGECIAILGATYTKGTGAPANGGGGGITDNGGGGASNYGAGGIGGKDGWMVTTCGLPAQGGKTLTYTNALNKIFLGGAGGDAQRSEGPGINMGVSGAGIVIIQTTNITGNNRIIYAQGNDAVNTIQDGGGGGGAGGTVLLDCPAYTGLLNVQTTGGKGGNANIYTSVNCSGGGGGGGGVLWVSTPIVNANIIYTSNGGLGGISQSPAVNGFVGQPGGTVTDLVIPASNNSLVVNAGPDVTICW